MVQGPWDDPIILPDPQSRIQRSGAAQPLLDAVRNRSARDPVRSAIERLTGATADPAAVPPTAAPNLTGSSTPVEARLPSRPPSHRRTLRDRRNDRPPHLTANAPTPSRATV